MEAVIANFRKSRHVQKNNQMIVYLDTVKTKDKAKELIGKKVVWKTQTGKEITGKVAAHHGNKGALRVIFEKGLPGQSLGTKVKLI